MDDRQTEIREGAGLENSRINQEFVDFLSKWSSPVLMTLAVAALVWAGLQWLERKKIAEVDQAFSELEAAKAGGNPSPTSLTTIADDYAGVRSVPELAKLNATDLYLRAFTVGVEPGAQFSTATRQVENPEDILDADQRVAYRDLAEKTANEVLVMSEGKSGKAIFAMQALSRLAAVQEGKRDFDAARGYYDRLKGMGEQEGYPTVVSFAEARIENLASFEQVSDLPTNEQVPLLPGQTPPLTQEQLNELIEQATNAQASESAGIDEPAGDVPSETPSDAPVEEPSEEPTEEPASSDSP